MHKTIERKVIDVISEALLISELGNTTTIKGPFTTLYWSNADKDNLVQQQFVITIDDHQFEILVRPRD